MSCIGARFKDLNHNTITIVVLNCATNILSRHCLETKFKNFTDASKRKQRRTIVQCKPPPPKELCFIVLYRIAARPRGMGRHRPAIPAHRRRLACGYIRILLSGRWKGCSGVGRRQQKSPAQHSVPMLKCLPPLCRPVPRPPELFSGMLETRLLVWMARKY